MKYTYKKVTKSKLKETDLDISYTTKDITIESKTFDQILNGTYYNRKNVIKDVNEYYELKKQKSLELKRKKYLDLLDKKISSNFTLENKLKSIEKFESDNLEVLDDTLLSYKEDKRLTKKIQRVCITNEVRDTGDSIADLAKWNSLLTTAVFLIYGTLTDTAKNKIPADQRAIVEAIYGMFKNTDTVADYNIKNYGLGFIEEMMTKESKIKTIVTGE